MTMLRSYFCASSYILIEILQKRLFGSFWNDYTKKPLFGGPSKYTSATKFEGKVWCLFTSARYAQFNSKRA